MTTNSLWKFLGGPGSFFYEFYDWFRRRLNRQLVDYCLSQFSNGKVVKILEAGSGTAYASILMNQRESVFAVAVDIDLEALREARRRDPGIPVVLADLRRLPFHNAVFDLAWNSSTIEHLENPGEALAEMSRLVTSGQMVFTGVPFRYGPLGFQPLIKNRKAGVWIGTVYSEKELSDLIEQVSLKPVEKIHYFFRFFIGILAKKL